MSVKGAGSTPIVNFMKMRDQIEQAAELASTNGKINLSKMPEQFRGIVGNEQSLDAFKKALQKTLTEVDRFDVGLLGGRGVPMTGACGSRTFEESAVANMRDYVEPPLPGLAGRLARIGGNTNIQLDPGERQRLMDTASAGAKSFVTLAEAEPMSRNAEAAKPFLPNLAAHTLSSLIIEGTPTGVLQAGPGGTKDIEEIKAKNLKTGEWFSVKPHFDGSYTMQIGRLNSADVALWMQPKGDAPPFFAGTLNMFYYSGANAPTPLTNHIGSDGVMGKLAPRSS